MDNSTQKNANKYYDYEFYIIFMRNYRIYYAKRAKYFH